MDSGEIFHFMHINIKTLLNYDIHTGLFTWRVDRGKIKKGALAGTLDKDGYIRIGINYKWYYAHHLAWAYFYNTWPSKEIDHINQIKDDNRIENLREVTRSENSQNKGVQSNNTSGVRGVDWHKNSNKWRVKIKINGKSYHLGYFDDLSEAKNAYQDAAKNLHTHQPNSLTQP